MKKVLLMSMLMLNFLHAQETSWGVEVNPLSLTSIDGDDKIFSGMLSYFDNTNATEIGISTAYQKFFQSNGYYESEVLNVALHYRKFVSKRTLGFYYGGFLSYTYLDGQLENDIRYATVNKLGLGGEIGARIMKTHSDWSFYWGPALRIGRYFGSNDNVFETSSLGMALYDRKNFIDVDFLRVGFRF